MKGRKGKREHGSKERDGKGKSTNAERGFGKWREAGLNEEKRGEREREEQLPRERKPPLLRGFRRPKSRVPKSTIPSPYP